MHVKPIYCNVLPNHIYSDWNRLLKKSWSPNFQFDFDYMLEWTKLLRADWKPLILEAQDKNEIKGYFPLMFRDEKRR